MTECCNDFGNCTQGRDCPIRKQRAQETNEAYVKGFLMGQEDPLDDLADTFKGLIAFMFVVAGLTMIAFAIWGK
jgi:hypothetical protein